MSLAAGGRHDADLVLVIAVGLIEKAETDYGKITENKKIIKEDASPRVRACSARQGEYTVLRERAHGGGIGNEARRFKKPPSTPEGQQGAGRWDRRERDWG